MALVGYPDVKVRGDGAFLLVKEIEIPRFALPLSAP